MIGKDALIIERVGACPDRRAVELRTCSTCAKSAATSALAEELRLFWFRTLAVSGVRCQPACKPGSVWRAAIARVMAIPLGRPLPAASSNQPGRRSGDGSKDSSAEKRLASPLFGFAPGGACHAAHVAARAVRSYRTLSPLPGPCGCRRFVFCGAFPGVAPAGRYPAPCLRGARTFLRFRKRRPSGRLARST